MFCVSFRLCLITSTANSQVNTKHSLPKKTYLVKFYEINTYINKQQQE